jgi:hypothetical protein
MRTAAHVNSRQTLSVVQAMGDHTIEPKLFKNAINDIQYDTNEAYL